MTRGHDLLRHEQHESFVDRPTPAFGAVVRALEALPDADRADAEAAHLKALEAWHRREGLTRSTGHACLGRLIGRQCAQSLTKRTRQAVPCGLPGADHPTLWLKDGIPEVYVTQPSQLDAQHMGQIAALCAGWGLQCTVRTWPAWHFPSTMLLIEVRRTPETPAPTRHPPEMGQESTVLRVIHATSLTATLDEIRAHGFMVSRGPHWELRHPWSRECERTQQPVIQVRLQRRYAAIEIDLAPSGRQWSEAGFEALLRLLDRLERAPRTCGVRGGARHVCFQDIPNDQAVMIAQASVALYRRAGMTAREPCDERWYPRRPQPPQADSERSPLQEWTHHVDALIADVHQAHALAAPEKR